MLTIKNEDIIDRELICPFCMNPVSSETVECCGEGRGYFEYAIITKTGNIHLQNEVFVM